MITEVWSPDEYKFCVKPSYAPRSLWQPTADTNNNNANNNNDRSNNEKTHLTTANESPVPLDTTEDEGYIITVLLNGRIRKFHILVFHENSVSSGPIAQVPLGMGCHTGCTGVSLLIRRHVGWRMRSIRE